MLFRSVSLSALLCTVCWGGVECKLHMDRRREKKGKHTRGRRDTKLKGAEQSHRVRKKGLGDEKKGFRGLQNHMDGVW